MKTAAIICEYNPFHQGHAYHIARTKELCGADFVVAIMSPNFVQRGDVALFSKELRAKAAIASGADLVLELPATFAMQSAEFFSKHGVFIAEATGLVDFLSFGAECESLDTICKIARLLCDEPPEFSFLLKAHLDKGIAYPAARAAAVSDILGEAAAETISTPNNILAVEYCKSLFALKSSIAPIAVKRIGTHHDSPETANGFASATHLRELIFSGKKEEALQYIPKECRKLFKDAKAHRITAMENSIIAELIKMPPETLAQISDVSEGMENRIKAAALKADSLDDLTHMIKTKRYTLSRIRRVLLSAYLGITDAHREMSVPYIKILDHNERGRELIRKMKKTSSLPIVRNTSQVNKLNNPEIKALWERERIFDKIYEIMQI